MTRPASTTPTRGDCAFCGRPVPDLPGRWVLVKGVLDDLLDPDAGDLFHVDCHDQHHEQLMKGRRRFK